MSPWASSRAWSYILIVTPFSVGLTRSMRSMTSSTSSSGVTSLRRISSAKPTASYCANSSM